MQFVPHIITGIKSQSQDLIYKYRFRFPQTGPFFASPGRLLFPAVGTECKGFPQELKTFYENIFTNLFQQTLTWICALLTSTSFYQRMVYCVSKMPISYYMMKQQARGGKIERSRHPGNSTTCALRHSFG